MLRRYTVEPPIKDTIQKQRTSFPALNDGCLILFSVYFQPPIRGHLPIMDKKWWSQCVLYIEVPLYIVPLRGALLLSTLGNMDNCSGGESDTGHPTIDSKPITSTNDGIVQTHCHLLSYTYPLKKRVFFASQWGQFHNTGMRAISLHCQQTTLHDTTCMYSYTHTHT